LSKALSPGHNITAIEESGLETLLDLDGNIFEMGEGYWVKIEAQRVPPDAGRPHGINYSLTLHSPAGERLVGYDNAHGVPVRAGRPDQITSPFDHTHRRCHALPYGYSDAPTLLVDFWRDVEKTLREEGVQ
jgi:hypothetical protein